MAIASQLEGEKMRLFINNNEYIIMMYYLPVKNYKITTTGNTFSSILR